jgi:hypothetical protein
MRVVPDGGIGCERALCACGCGQPTPIANRTRAARGQYQGLPMKWIPHHHINGGGNPRWNGGSKINERGVWLAVPGTNSYEKASRRIVETALGHKLPATSVVHHRDRNSVNNDLANFIVCQDRAYHKLVHLREDAYRATGNANSRKCYICHKWDTPGQHFRVAKKRRSGMAYHLECSRRKQRLSRSLRRR